MKATVSRVHLDPRQKVASISLSLDDGTFIGVNHMPFDPPAETAYASLDDVAVREAVKLLNAVIAD